MPGAHRDKNGGVCGTASASSNKLYYRARHPVEFDLKSKELDSITSTTRSGCWIDKIFASGLLLVPGGQLRLLLQLPRPGKHGIWNWEVSQDRVRRASQMSANSKGEKFSLFCPIRQRTRLFSLKHEEFTNGIWRIRKKPQSARLLLDRRPHVLLLAEIVKAQGAEVIST